MQAEEILARATAPQRDTRPMPKAMLVFAHPDDETFALGARLARFASAHLVHVTDGAPRDEQDSKAHGFATLDDYRNARAHELEQMMKQAGISTMSHESLNIPDQEACLDLGGLTRRIAELLETYPAEVIFTHPYEGGHPDHDACAFAVHHAVALQSGRTTTLPLIIEGAFYHAGTQGFEAGTFLPEPNATAVTYSLSREEQQRKEALLDCFTSQRETLRGVPLDCERFRISPEYEFCNPPHAGRLLYENYPWGMSAQRFLQLAAEAQAQLQQLPATTCD